MRARVRGGAERSEVQKYVVRMLFMAPIYGIVALLCLTFRDIAPYITIIRDGYVLFFFFCGMTSQHVIACMKPIDDDDTSLASSVDTPDSMIARTFI